MEDKEYIITDPQGSTITWSDWTINDSFFCEPADIEFSVSSVPDGSDFITKGTGNQIVW